MPYQTRLAQILIDAGLPVMIVPHWQNRGGIDFEPVGIINHHTAGGIKGGAHAELAHVINDATRGVLCNLYVCRLGEVHVIAAGRAAHAGQGLTSVRQNVARGIAPTGDARLPGIMTENRNYFGIEVENNGIGETYSERVIDTLVRTNAAICKAYGWTAARCIHHRESTSRKIDMSWGAPGTKARVHHPQPYLRERIAAVLDTPPRPQPVPPPKPKVLRMFMITDPTDRSWLCAGVERTNISWERVEALRAIGVDYKGKPPNANDILACFAVRNVG